MTESQLFEVVQSFSGKSFSTLQFCQHFQVMFPNEWREIVQEYGEGGKGAGTNYSAYSRVAHYLNKQANDDNLDKLDYRDSPAEWGSRVIRYWSEDKSKEGAQHFPDEITIPETVTEGLKTTIVVNRYERDKSARSKCIEKWGIQCAVCNFDFERFYGAIGAGFIHVHHLKPISAVGKEYELDPVNDLRPLCPNCHAMVHRRTPALSIDEVKQCIEKKI